MRYKNPSPFKNAAFYMIYGGAVCKTASHPGECNTDDTDATDTHGYLSVKNRALFIHEKPASAILFRVSSVCLFI
jgi:hypothetical protein